MGADGGQDNATVKNPESVDLVAKLLGLESSKDLCFALITLRTETRGNIKFWVYVKLNTVIGQTLA